MVKRTSVATLALIASTALFTIGAAAPAVSAATQYASNTPVQLSNLVGPDNVGNTLLVGDKVFSDFSYSTTGSDMPDASAVTITGETTGSGSSEQWGFNISGQFQDTDSPNSSDALLRYTVTVVDPAAFLISGVGIKGNPDVTGTGSMTVSESWTPDVGSQKVGVYDIEPDGPTQLDNSITLDMPAASLTVTKDILASVPDAPVSYGPFAGPLVPDDGDLAKITSIDQLYSQTPTSGSGVPEPASLSLLALGAAGLLTRRRR